MVYLVVLAAIFLVVVAAGALLRRRFADESSVDRHHRAIGAISEASHRNERSTIRILERHESPGYVPPRTSINLEESGLDPDVPIVFDEARPRDRGAPAPVPSGQFRSDRDRRHALDSMNRRPRRAGPALAAIAAVAFIVALAIVGGAQTGRGSKTTRTTAARPPSGRHQSHPAVSPTTSTSTTAPATLAAYGTSSYSASRAIVPVGNATYTVTVLASTNPVWVQATDALSGKTLFAGTVPAGQSQQISGTGTTDVLVGATSQLEVGTSPVVLPSSMAAPMTVVFTSATPVSVSAPTTTTSTTRGIP